MSKTRKLRRARRANEELQVLNTHTSMAMEKLKTDYKSYAEETQRDREAVGQLSEFIERNFGGSSTLDHGQQVCQGNKSWLVVPTLKDSMFSDLYNGSSMFEKRELEQWTFYIREQLDRIDRDKVAIHFYNTNAQGESVGYFLERKHLLQSLDSPYVLQGIAKAMRDHLRNYIKKQHLNGDWK